LKKSGLPDSKNRPSGFPDGRSLFFSFIRRAGPSPAPRGWCAGGPAPSARPAQGPDRGRRPDPVRRRSWRSRRPRHRCGWPRPDWTWTW